MKKGLHNITITVGIVVLCASIFGFGVDRFGYLNIPDDKRIWIIMTVGVAIIFSGVLDALITSNAEIKKELEIEAKDERNLYISRAAKSFAYDIMTILFSVTITLLALIGKISTIVFIIFFGIYVVTQIAYIYKLKNLHVKM